MRILLRFVYFFIDMVVLIEEWLLELGLIDGSTWIVVLTHYPRIYHICLASEIGKAQLRMVKMSILLLLFPRHRTALPIFPRISIPFFSIV